MRRDGCVNSHAREIGRDPPRNPYKDRFEVNIRFKIEPNGGAVDGGGGRVSDS